ncbi:TIGR00153 family protein [Candidatus Pacearchaeota archaeon]|nr:MAG: TIGR00153 family protein [Candidatus Pacearchaeota archaeon]
MLEKLLSGGKLEKKTLELIRKYLSVLCAGTECFNSVLISKSKEKTYCVESLEREADSIKREIISTIYEGAFLPYIRPNLCTFIEILEKVFDFLKHAAFEYRYLNFKIFRDVEEDCIKVSKFNVEMCKLLSKAFECLIVKDNLREKNLAIRIYEKKIDELKFEIIEKLRNIHIENFWDGKVISNFIDYLTNLSNLIEDASDYLSILYLSLH